MFDCADANCGAGTAYMPANTPFGTHNFVSLGIRSNGLPLIATGQSQAGHMVYACSDAACTTGSATGYESRNGLGSADTFSLDMALGSDDRGLVVSEGKWNLTIDLRVQSCVDTDCTDATETPINNSRPQFPDVAIRTAAVPADERPFITYTTSLGKGLEAYDCGDATCSTGEARILDTAGSSFDIGRPSSVLRENGTPLIAYTKLGQIRLVNCQDAGCADFTTYHVQQSTVFKDGFEDLILGGSSTLAQAPPLP